ncbi:uncharacterized protein [Lolium perenne]|uniref:uncharacterized protein isoform X2 n=1 Tax=Lolium perenne TaxID=4522 RepID=UPI0021F50D0F|nr:uncharacterized protein LOC127344924 isoform X2 [Lolium perenne]
MATSPAAPAPAAPAAADAPANPHKRKNKGKGGGNPNKKKKLLKGPDDRRRRNKPSAKFLKLLEKRARDYNSDDEDDVKVQRQPRRLQPRPPKRRDGAGAGDAAPDEAEADAPSSEEEASSSGGESDDGEKVVTRFEEGCRAFRVAFTKIMSKRLADDPLGPILSAHKKLVAAKLAEEADEHRSKGDARKEKRIAAQKGHVMPANHVDNKEKMLIKVATQGVVRLFNEVSKRQARKGLNPSRSKALAKEGTHSVPSSQGQKGQASSKFSKHIGKDEDEPGWAPLRDTYMLGTKLKDWDKAQDSDVAQQTEVPLDNFSDDE